MIMNIIAGFLSGIIGSMGMGGGGILLIYLSVFKNVNQLKAGGINLIFFIPIAILSLIIYTVKKQIKWQTTILISVSGVAGALLGTYLATVIGNKWLGKIFGGFILLLGIIELFRKTKGNE